VALGPDRTSKGSSTRAGAFAATIAPMRPTTAPSPPTSVNVHPVGTGAVVRWSPPVDDGGSQVTLYTVTVSPGGERCATTRLGCRVEGLVAGHLYRASVTDSTVIGTSARTRPISFVPLR
jgi:hypothetical protein